jgi:hypothetical protein
MAANTSVLYGCDRAALGKLMVLDSAAQFKPIAALPFSLDRNSAFFKVQEVYDISLEMKKKGYF